MLERFGVVLNPQQRRTRVDSSGRTGLSQFDRAFTARDAGADLPNPSARVKSHMQVPHSGGSNFRLPSGISFRVWPRGMRPQFRSGAPLVRFRYEATLVASCKGPTLASEVRQKRGEPGVVASGLMA
jgi:hypothetical protein